MEYEQGVGMQLSAPKPLTAPHVLDGFNCGEPSLDDWLKRRALANRLNGASRTFVVVDANQYVFGYHALETGAVAYRQAASAVRRNMPDPVPVMVLARLAEDARAQRIKLGAALLQDAVTRVRSVAENAGVRALLVHASYERAKQFYEHDGFRSSPIHRMA
ncbi:GNAT family N-acetyltransferase [Xanthomonas phaseoli]|uniref:GNAT family N-acetyltransferase n=2 Tax=Xanthomonas TaxID=338 RepID=UPI001F2C3E75|nr:GNAT family N-acetyltransferase [Xanthomonas phaseoli]